MFQVSNDLQEQLVAVAQTLDEEEKGPLSSHRQYFGPFFLLRMFAVPKNSR